MNSTGVYIYVDGTVPIEDHCNNTVCMSIAAAVWEKVQAQVCNWAATELGKNSVLNTAYIPSTLVI